MTDDNAAFRRIEQAIARLGTEHAPPPGWESRVLAAVAAHDHAASHRPHWRVAAAVATAVAILALVLWWDHPQSPEPLALVYQISPGTAVVRSSEKSAMVGDTITSTARGGRHRALWVYRPDGTLLTSCPGSAACQETEKTLTARFALDSVGTYFIVAVSAEEPPPVPRGSYDADLAGVSAAKAKMEHQVKEVLAQ